MSINPGDLVIFDHKIFASKLIEPIIHIFDDLTVFKWSMHAPDYVQSEFVFVTNVTSPMYYFRAGEGKLYTLSYVITPNKYGWVINT